MADRVRHIMYVCLCTGITDHDIRHAMELGARSVDDLRTGLGVGLRCGRCVAAACSVLGEALGAQPATHDAGCVAEPA